MDIFYINLAGQTERRRLLEDSFRATQIPGWRLNRIEAVSAEIAARSAIPGAIRDAEKGCFLSHIAAIIQANTCINFLRQVDGAKQEWALEHKKTANDVPTPTDLTPYLKNPSEILCPAGGAYSINAVGVAPTCSVPGHSLK